MVKTPGTVMISFFLPLIKSRKNFWAVNPNTYSERICAAVLLCRHHAPHALS